VLRSLVAVRPSAWELDCHAYVDQHVAGRSPCPVVRGYPLDTALDSSIGHATGTLPYRDNDPDRFLIREILGCSDLRRTVPGLGLRVRSRPATCTCIARCRYSVGCSGLHYPVFGWRPSAAEDGPSGPSLRGPRCRLWTGAQSSGSRLTSRRWPRLVRRTLRRRNPRPASSRGFLRY